MDPVKLEILTRLNEGEAALGAALAGLDAQSACAAPASGRWSVVEIVEHLAVSEEQLLERLRLAWPSPASTADPAREARLESLALNRERRIDAPEPVVPTGACATLDAALARFRSVRAETVQFIADFPGDLRSSLVQHPLIPRPLNCYEMLLLMALHPIRHAAQIAENRAIGDSQAG